MHIIDVAPREQNGRDTITRYRVQYKAIAIHCLKLLESDEIQCIYCDYQDDFAVELRVSGKTIYEFYQVKTQGDEKPLRLLLLFGIKKTKKNETPKSIADSFAGKLLLHTINFGDDCSSVSLLTNAFFDDDIKAIKDDLECKAFAHDLTQRLLKHLPSALPSNPILDNDGSKQTLQKLKLEGGLAHLSPDEGNPYFLPYARDLVTKYSEIELKPRESAKIIENLCALVQRKSAGKLKPSISRENLKKEAGVNLNDVLGILSISTRAFEILKKSGDKSAVKTTSILTRVLNAANFTEEQIEFCAICKVKYDEWQRQYRHTIQQTELLRFQHQLSTAFSELWKRDIEMSTFLEAIKKAWDSSASFSFHTTLSEDHIMGGFLSELVWKES